MRSRNQWFLIISVLVLALLIGVGITEWRDDRSNTSFALEQAQSNQPQPVSEVQAQVAQVMPSQEVLSSLYDTASPSVVNIRVAQMAQASPGIPGFPGLPGLPFGQPDSGQGAPILQGQGSGFIYDDQGHIVTNNHVVADASIIVVYFNNGMWAEAELVARDPAADLAVLNVTPPEGMDWRPLPLAPADSVREGFYVVALGSPFGLEQTMTTGIVSAIGRSFPTGEATGGPSYSLPDVIQTDAAINPGNSGGPLLNLQGEVVGVNFAINSPVRANSGVGFAIPVSIVEKVVPALINEGSFSYAYLGVAGSTIDAAVAQAADLEPNQLGLYVGQVVAGGPADEAGVQEGDIIVAIDDEPVTAFEDLISYLLRQTDPGDSVTLTLLRGGDMQTVEVTLGERPAGQTEGDQPGMAIPVTEALRIARDAVIEAGLMEEIESANARPEQRDSGLVWVVTLTGNNNTATVVVDGQTGEVLELDVQ